MYEHILKNKHKTYAFDPKNGIVSFENTKNINEIIKTQNSLEELKAIYKVIEEEYNTKISEIQKFYKKILIIAVVSSIFGILLHLPFSFMLGITLAILKNFSVKYAKESKIKKLYTKKLTMISNSIEEENQKLNNLNKTDEKVVVECEQPKIVLNRSDEIEFLYDKLSLIDFVSINKSNLKRLYKEDLLEETLEKGLSEKEIEFIKSLLCNKNKIKQLKK